MKEIWKNLSANIVGQEKAKKEILSDLFRLCNRSYNKSIVIMFIGDSGIGKTETARVISQVLGGNLLRVQFSMMQAVEGYNYIFGSEHSKSSFAKDLMSRISNIVLIDAFDKVNPNFYNAFYQMFDDFIMFEYLSFDEKEKILSNVYHSYLESFTDEEKTLIENSDIYNWHRDNLSRFKNIRIIKSRVEKAIHDVMSNEIIYK